MNRSAGKWVAVLLCVLMVIGGLDLGALGGPIAGQMASNELDGKVGPSASSRAIVKAMTTTFDDWKAGGIVNLTAHNESGGEVRISGYEAFTIPLPNIVEVRDLEVDSSGNLYVATGPGNIVKIDAATGDITDHGRAVPDEDNLNRLKMARNDTLWGGGRSNVNTFGQDTPNRGGILWRMNTSSMRFDADWKPEPVQTQIRGLTIDVNGTVWAGTTGGVLARFDPTNGAVTRLNGGNALIAGYGIFQLAAAQNGIVYAGTQAGVDGGHLIKIDPTTNSFTVMNGHNPLVNNDGISSMATAKNGTIYIGTGNAQAAILMLDPATDTITNLGKAMPGAGNVGDLYPAPDGSVFGTMGAGTVVEPHLLKIEAGTGARIDMGIPVLVASGPLNVAVAPDGTVWFGAVGGRLVKLAPSYSKLPVGRLDRMTSGRIFTENFELSSINWDTASSPGTNNYQRVADQSRPADDLMVYRQQDTTSGQAYSRAGPWGPVGTDADAFNINPGGVMEVSIKFNNPGVTTPGGLRLFMGATGSNTQYALGFNEDTNAITLYRDWAQVTGPYLGMSIDRNIWYDVKWKVYHTGVGPGAAFTVWINNTVIFNEVPIFAPHHPSGAVMVGTRYYNGSFDNLRLYKDTNITVNGLQAGQKVDLYAGNGTLLKTATAAAASVVLGVDAISFPLTGYITVTATDGTTIVHRTPTMSDIYGGDVYNYVSPVNATSTWRYMAGGIYTSQPYDAHAQVSWLNISWVGQTPPNTNISVRTRTASTMGGLSTAAWSAPSLLKDSAITSSANRWIQFQANLTTADVLRTPELQEVSFKFKAFPNFTVQMTQSASLVYPNDIITYTIYYNQTGNANAKDVIIADVLGPDLVFVNSSAEAERNGAVWRFSNVALGEGRVLSVQARVASNVADKATITNRATLEFTDDDGAVIGNISSASVQATAVRPVADVALDGPATAGPGDSIDYLIAYNNTGSGMAGDLWLNLTLDANITIVGSTAEGQRNGTSWNVTDVPGNSDGNITVHTKVNVSVADNTSMEATVGLEYRAPNGYQPAGKSVGPVVTKTKRAVLQIGKTVDLTTAMPGDSIVYKVRFNNTGSAAGKVVIKDVLAPQLTFVTSSSEANRTGDSWTYASVPAGSRNELTITALVKEDVPEGTVVNNTATVDLSTPAGVPIGTLATNVVSTKVVALSAPKITVAMVSDKATAFWNETVTFKVYYNNTGNSLASAVSMKVQLPKGLIFVASSAEANRTGSYWNFTTVATGDHYFTITTKVFSGTANNSIETVLATLNYTDARGKARPGSSASVPVVVKELVKPPVDLTKPTITGKVPTPGSKDVPAATTIEITFSEAMNRTETEKALSISPKVSGKFTWNGNKLIFTPDKPLKAGQKYTVNVEPDARDLAGNKLDPVSSWSFTVKGRKVDDSSSGLLCLAAIIGFIVALIAGIYFVMSRRKAKKAPDEIVYSRRAPSEDGPTTVPPRPKTRGVRKEAPPPMAEVVAEEELAEPEPPAPVEIPPEPVVEEVKPLEEVPEPGPPEPVKEEAPPPEEKPPEPPTEERPPDKAPEPEVKTEELVKEEPAPEPPKDEGKASLDDILKKLKQ